MFAAITDILLSFNFFTALFFNSLVSAAKPIVKILLYFFDIVFRMSIFFVNSNLKSLSLLILFSDKSFTVKSETAATDTKISQPSILSSTEKSISFALFTSIDCISSFCL